MTAAKPRRYVRVRMIHHGELASWRCRLCIALGGYWPVEVALDLATEHARKCEAVRIATERDQLRTDRAAWRTIAIRLQADLIEAREERA